MFEASLWIRRMVDWYSHHPITRKRRNASLKRFSRDVELANEKSDFVSQEMASSYSHNNDIPLATLLEWYKIRDTFLRENFVSRDIPLALKLASSCDHPDARWLTEACAGKDVTTVEGAKRIFSALGQNDARALCFSWMLGDREDFTPLRRSAELGFAFAQALLARNSRRRVVQVCSACCCSRRVRWISLAWLLFSFW
jgi:hypothetical protein